MFNLAIISTAAFLGSLIGAKPDKAMACAHAEVKALDNVPVRIGKKRRCLEFGLVDP
jgi:hypothetical protein